MFTQLKYTGTYPRKITWNSMGECFSYNVHPGDIISVPSSQARNAQASGTFDVVSQKSVNHGAKIVRKFFEKEASESLSESDVQLLQDQSKLSPFAKVGTNEEVEIEIEDVPVTKPAAVLDKPVLVKPVQFIVEDKSLVKNDTDFASKTKKELVAWLIQNGSTEKDYVLLKEKKDTLISLCVEKQAAN